MIAKIGQLRLNYDDEWWPRIRESQLLPGETKRKRKSAGVAEGVRSASRSSAGSSVARARNAGRWRGRGSDWATSLELYEKLHEEFQFTCDVCATAENAKHVNFFGPEDDALTLDWGKERCFMNPPFGKVLHAWMKKAYESSLNGALVVALVPANTDSQWWHEFALRGEIRYLGDRPWFTTPEGIRKQTFSPCVLVIFKPACAPAEVERLSVAA